MTIPHPARRTVLTRPCVPALHLHATAALLCSASLLAVSALRCGGSLHHLSARPFNHTKTWDPNPQSDGARIGELVLTTKHGDAVLLDPLLNKGTGFLQEERERLGIRGLVPPRHPFSHESALQAGVNRVMNRYWSIPRSIEKYSYLIALQDRNEVLFYRCLLDNIEKLAPIIYTPTVGEACQSFSSLFRRPRGMYFSYADKGNMHSMVWNWPSDDVEIIVVTDGSRILGLGDLGTNGMVSARDA